MAGEEAAGGSRSRRRMDLNLYLGLPPLPRPPGRLDVAADCPSSLPNSASSVPRTDELRGLPAPALEEVPPPPAPEEVPPPPAPEEVLPPPALYSPSNALSTPEQSMLDPMIFTWLDGHSTDSEDALDVVEPVVALDVPSYGVNESPPPMLHPPFTGLEGDDVLGPWAERFSHPGRVFPATRRVEMVSTGELRHSSGIAIEAMMPELRFRRLIQVSEQHHIVRPGPVANRNQQASSPETERLVQAIQRSHSSLDELRLKKVDGGCKVGGTAAVKDGSCGCNSSFDCNICLDTAKEPVVTPCGHLFCWPCLYQWLHGHSVHSECPVCKGEVLEINVTPIYGRGGAERDASGNDVPPRPRANRSESLRQLLQMPDPRGIASMVRRLIENQDVVRGQAAPPVGVDVTVLPAGRPRGRGGRRQQRQDNNALPSVPAIQLLADNVNPESGNQVPLPSSNADNAAPAVPTAPQQSSSMEQASTSSTMAVIVGEPAQSRRSRPSESTTPRRTRRRQQ